jgi:hypothetical protein
MKPTFAQSSPPGIEFVSSRLRSRRQSQVSDGRLRRERDSTHKLCLFQKANQVAVDKTS